MFTSIPLRAFAWSFLEVFKMNIASLFSGAKDSTFATYLSSMRHKTRFLVTIISENPESYMFHTSNISLTKLQANAMQIPLVTRKTKGMKETELNDLKNVLKELKAEGIEGVVSGGVMSNYQKSRIDKICKDLGLKHMAPLWHKDPVEILRNMIKDGFEIIMTAVGAPPLDEAWLGRKIDNKCVNDLIELNKKYGINILGEGGEFETFVLNCPMFKKKIEILDNIKHWDVKTQSGWLEIRKAELVAI